MEEARPNPARQAQARPGRRRGTLRLLLLGFSGAFLLGVAATWTMLSDSEFSLRDLLTFRADDDLPAVAVDPESADAPPLPVASGPAALVAQEARQTAQAVERMAEQTGGIDQRVAAMEQRLTRLDLQSQAAAGNAARAEGLLIAFAARRALERGSPLGYLEDQLRLRFGDARPNAVQTIIAAAADPVTLDQLMTRLEGLAPTLTETPKDAGLFSRVASELSQIFVIRTDDTPSPLAERRLHRARIFLESGRIDHAVGEVRNLPNAAQASGWIADAQRFAAAQRALEVLETAAVLEPRQLRDGSGRRVEQPSPAGGTPTS